MTRRVFVSEFLSSGAWPEPSIPDSLAREGTAMLLCVIRDFLNDPSIELRTTWDQRLGEFPGRIQEQCKQLTVIEVDSNSREFETFDACCHWATDVLVIAPEFHDILINRRKRFDACADHPNAHSTNWMGCDLKSIRLCGDKLQFAEHLQLHRIATVNTQSFSDDRKRAGQGGALGFPLIVKPRHGAGSVATHRLDSERELHEFANSDSRTEFEFIVQPFVEGELVSCAAIIDQGRLTCVLPPGKPAISRDSQFQYQGMDLDVEVSQTWACAAEELIAECCEAIPGLNGYVGFDLIAPKAKPSSLCVLEINPRVTTGILAWQQLHDAQVSEGLTAGRCSLLEPRNCEQQLERIKTDRPIRFRLATESHVGC
jgi:predicted ATP-grasp superfamily ATP-dependent carboligase